MRTTSNIAGAGCVDTQWYLDTKDGLGGDKLTTTMGHIRERTRWRRDADRFHAERYAGGPGVLDIGAMSATSNTRYTPSTTPRNVCKQATDTMVAKVAKHRPLPQVLTARGSWGDQKRARKQTQLLDGVFHKTRFFEQHAPDCVRDACVFGRGIVRVYEDRKRICVERVVPWELYVDDWDARYGEPRNIYQCRTMDLGVAFARFGAKREGEEQDVADARKKALYDASSSSPGDDWDWEGSNDSTVLRVRIIEAYHLCDDESAHDDDEEHECTGRHCVSVYGSDVMLVSEAYEEAIFPYAVMSYSKPLAGYFGTGLVEQLEGWQAAVDEQFEKVQDGHHMLGGGMLLVPIGSDIVDTSLHNGVVPIIKHQPGKPPQWVTPAPVHPAVYQRERDMPIDALAEAGLSQTSTQAQHQPGIESGIAIQTMDDIESERHVIFGRAYESWCLTVARLFIASAARIAKRYGDMAVSVPMKGGLLKLSWKDVKLKDFQLRVYPTSLLPEQLAGRLDKLKMLFEAQLIDRQTFLQQLDAPDLNAELDLDTAARMNIDEKLEAIRDADEDELEEVYRSPSSYQDFRWAQKRAQQVFNKAESDGCPEANLDALREFMAECQTLIDNDPASQPAPPMGPAMPPPMGDPMVGPVPMAA